jgi:hypothetical protein
MKIASFILLSAVLAAGCVKKEISESTSFPAVVEEKTITHLVVDVDAEDVVIVPSKDGTSGVEANLEYCGKKPEHKVVVNGSTMRLTMDCHSSCSGQFFITVPAQVSSDIHLGAGDIEISDLTGELDITTGAGNIRLTRVSGALNLRSGAGNIDGIDFKSTTYTVKTGAGNISLDAKTTPTYAKLKSGVGNVDLSVPSNSYNLSISNGIGTTEVHGLTTDESSPNVIQAHSGVGNVSVVGI